MSKIIKKMNAEQFADYLCDMKEDQIVEFGCEYDGDNDDLNIYDVGSWYFVKIMEVPEYDSRFLVVDYCGGEEAYSIPLNNYCNKIDDDDKNIIHDYMNEYFTHWNRFLSDKNDIVYVCCVE